MMSDVAAWVAALILAAVAIFQLALVAGAPWRHMSYGGRAGTSAGVVPGPYRIMSGAAVVVLAFAAWIVLASADVVADTPLGEGFMDVAIWVVFGYLALNTVMNALSPNTVERYAFGAATLVAALACLAVAIEL